MSLSVIGAGFGRTGTLSLKGALEHLGFGPCYHMAEVFGHPHFLKFWVAAAEGEPMDWDEVFKGYRATVDWPGASYWRELAERYPEAKVILSVRSPESWYESAQATISSNARTESKSTRRAALGMSSASRRGSSQSSMRWARSEMLV